MKTDHEGKLLVGGLAASWVYSSMLFLVRFFNDRTDLFYRSGNQALLRAGAVMTDFGVLVNDTLWGFVLLAVCMLCMAVFRYAYFYRDSKSICLMRRLPDRWELHRRCLALPLAAVAVCLLAASLVLLADLAVYYAFTPGECLTPHQWQKLWSVIL